MLQFLAALAEALPAAGKFIDAVTHHEDTASKAAAVAADKNAPQDVKQAAANIANKAIDDEAATKKAALAATTGKAPRDGDSTAVMIVGGLLLLLAMSKR